MKSSLVVLSLITVTLSSCSLTKSKPGTVPPQPIVAKQSLENFDVVGQWKGSVTGLLQIESDSFKFKLAASALECKEVVVGFTEVAKNRVAQRLRIELEAKCVDALGFDRKLKIKDVIALTGTNSKINPNKVILETQFLDYWSQQLATSTKEIGSFQGAHAVLKSGSVSARQLSEGLGSSYEITGDVVQTSQDELAIDFKLNAEYSNYFINELSLDMLEVKGTLSRVKEE